MGEGHRHSAGREESTRSGERPHCERRKGSKGYSPQLPRPQNKSRPSGRQLKRSDGVSGFEVNEEETASRSRPEEGARSAVAEFEEREEAAHSPRRRRRHERFRARTIGDLTRGERRGEERGGGGVNNGLGPENEREGIRGGPVLKFWLFSLLAHRLNSCWADWPAQAAVKEKQVEAKV